MKFLQINLNHCEVAKSFLEQNVIEKNVDMALINEQYRNKNSGEDSPDAVTVEEFNRQRKDTRGRYEDGQG